VEPEKNLLGTVIVWLRRDLRIRDNKALFEACRRAQRVVPLFVFDDTILSREDTGPARIAFLLDALHVLDRNLQNLGGRLILRRGQAVEQVLRAVSEFNADGVFFQREYEPYGRARDAQISEVLAKDGKICEKFPGLSLFSPEEIQSATGNPYTVFGPYKKIWFSCPADAPVSAPVSVKLPEGAKSDVFPSVSDLKFQIVQHFVCGGEDAAQALLADFIQTKIAAYGTTRDFLAEDGTSRLSRHLHFGTLGVREVVAAVRASGQEQQHSVFLTEIAWRDFYLHILWHFPHVAEGAFKSRFDAILWENGPELFAAWTQGRTGYPIVDAAMRQLNAEAWMHNRGRMIVASFLTKDLLIDWRWGEQYFMKQLVDGDQASNNGGWQWAAGTGTDAQPFFRIFNPTLQGKKFDPDGAYVRRWVPELARVPSKYIHEPWRLSAAERDEVGANDYPSPVVYHAAQRDRALALYASVGAS
jgi:deoxyribodipyrimidine photo-lyase